MNSNFFIIKSKCIIVISMALFLISIGLQTKELYTKGEKYEINYEYVNIKDMAQAAVKTKENSSSIISDILNKTQSNGSVTEVSLPEKGNVQEVELPVMNNTEQTQETPRQIWRLPTEVGRVTQYPHYGHAAYDITSPRTYSENIFPVANGVISSIYTDPAGAKVVTILHTINGVKYTSQYAHLSQYASGLYVGKEVTVNDSLGLMGSTGKSTGPHLHIAVADCALFDPNDTNCSDLNNWFRYVNGRLSQNYYGLGVHVYVPVSWESR